MTFKKNGAATQSGIQISDRGRLSVSFDEVAESEMIRINKSNGMAYGKKNGSNGNGHAVNGNGQAAQKESSNSLKPVSRSEKSSAHIPE